MTDSPQENLAPSNVGQGPWRGSIFGLGAALCFSTSPIFIRQGLVDLPSPLLGVTIGIMATTLAYGLALLGRGKEIGLQKIPVNILLLQLFAGTALGLSTWVRWLALDLAPVGVVIALGRLSVPVVLILAPIVIGQNVERVTGRVWIGATLIVIGSLLLILYR